MCKRYRCLSFAECPEAGRAVNLSLKGTASGGASACFHLAQTSDTGDCFVPELETICEMNKFIKFSSISQLRLSGHIP